MNRLSAFAAASCFGLVGLALAPTAIADQWNKKTIITIGEPIQVPGKVLQPGKYVMKLLDSQVNRHVVQIFNEQEDQVQATILAIPNYRLQATGKSEFHWWETPAGQPKALRAWFYPGDNFGHEFAYPKSEAITIAASVNANVPTTYAATEAELASARIGTVDRVGTEMELDRQTYARADEAPINEITPQYRTSPPPDTVEKYHTGVWRDHPTMVTTQTSAVETERNMMAAAAPNRNADVQSPDRMSADRLPETASPAPMVGLAGLLALGASIAVRKLRSLA